MKHSKSNRKELESVEIDGPPRRRHEDRSPRQNERWDEGIKINVGDFEGHLVIIVFCVLIIILMENMFRGTYSGCR